MRGIALLVVILAALANASEANAHASLIRSEPADRAVVAQPPPQLTLTFNEPVSPVALRLVRPSGEVIELNDIALRGATFAVALPAGLSRGTHLLSWRVISADSHPVFGTLAFSVGQPSDRPSALAQTDGDIRLRGAIWTARLVLYLALFTGVGGAFYCRWIAAAPPSGSIRGAVNVALGCGLVAALLSAGLHGVDVLGVPPSAIRQSHTWVSGLGTAYGLTLGLAAAALALGLAANATNGKLARWCAALALAGVGFALAASGHAATAGPEWATRPALFLHGVSVAFWVGALWPLAAALRANDGRSDLPRFSKASPWPLAALVVSGLLLAVVQVQRLNALWMTAYGMVLSAKLVAVCALLALAAMNRRSTPRVAAGDAAATRRLVRSIRIELAIVFVILGLVATWRFTPPPRSLQAIAAQPIHVHIHGDKAMADLKIEPGRSSGRRITVNLLDGEFRPLSAKEVVLFLFKPDAGIEPLRLPTARAEATIWQSDDVSLPISGRWHVRVEILISDFEKLTLEDEIEFR